MSDVDWGMDLGDWDEDAEYPPDSPWQDIDAFEGGWCCYQSAADGDPTRCTCWDPIFDLDQHRPLMVGVDPVVRPGACSDCAYRADSPERTELGMEHELCGLAEGRGRFWCHDGMRRPKAWVHRGTGNVRPGSPMDYQPPMVRQGAEMVPYRADGLPGFVCAGWELRHRLAGSPEIRVRTGPSVHICR